ncbi:MAG: hypothetical protein FWE31_03100 [Firmicutes bacterium]|nr:hypothetical protein [Bacillota bacterium]
MSQTVQIGNNLIVFTVPTSTATTMDWSVVDLKNLSGGIIQSSDSVVACIAYNVIDESLYGYDVIQHQIVRIDDQFQLTYLGIPLGMSPGINWAGTIDTNGFMYLSNDSATEYYTVDLRPSSTTFLQLLDPTNGYAPIQAGRPYVGITPVYVAGWTSLSDGKLYGIWYGSGENAGKMTCINPSTGEVTILETTYPMPTDYQFRAITRDINDTIYAISPTAGKVFQFTINGGVVTGADLGALDLGYMYLEAVLSPYANPFGIVANTAEFDIQACDGEEPTTIQSNREDVDIVNLIVEKIASCSVVFPGGIIKYCVTVTNPSNNEFQSTFRDVLNPLLTYVSGSFTVDGVSEAPNITGKEISFPVTIPENGSAVICFKARVS